MSIRVKSDLISQKSIIKKDLEKKGVLHKDKRLSKTQKLSETPENDSTMKMQEADERLNQTDYAPKNIGTVTGGLKRSAQQRLLSVSIKKKKSDIDIDYEVAMFKRKQSLLKPSKINMSIAALKKVDYLDEEFTSQKKNIPLRGKSCGIFTDDHRIRRLCKWIVELKYYDSFVMVLIFASTILLTLDNPLNDQNGTLSITLDAINYFMTAAFTIESIINIILLGFVFNGRGSYLRDSWNVLDFLIVFFSLINVAA